MIPKILLLIFIPSSLGANILAILPTPSYSHQIAFTHLWKELSLRGHKVTLITTDPLKDPKLTNLTELDMKWTYKFVGNISKRAETEYSMWNTHHMTHSLLSSVVEAQLSHPDVQNLIHKKHNFDVVLVEFLFPELLAFAEIYDCPKIVFGTLDVTAITHGYMGNPITPALYPEMGATFYGSLSFKERIISTLYTWFSLHYHSFTVFVDRTKVVKKFFNISRTVHELVNDVDMLFLSLNPILLSVRAFGPTTIMVGGDRNVVSSTTLPKDIAEFLDNAVDGFVYFSLGSNVKSKDLNKDSLEGITEALREIPYKVLWKFETDEFPNKPENVKLIKWAPQQTVLSHPNIKVFVTQGGLQSSEETFYRGVPVVVIPFFGDQEQNAKMLETKGIGVIVNRKPSIQKEELKRAIMEVATNPKYGNTVKKLRQLALDSPMTGLEKAVWWTEYVIRNKGAKHLRNPAADIPYYQYYLVDVIGFLIFVLVATFSVLYLLLRTLYRSIHLLIVKYSVRPKLSKNKKE